MLKIYDKFEKEIWSTKEGEDIWSWPDKRIRFTEPLIGAFITRQDLSRLQSPCFTLHKGALDNSLFLGRRAVT